MWDLKPLGWPELLSIAQIVITIIIAAFGFRSFRRWKREKIEERKMDVAVEALSVAYEVESVFGYIRQAVALSGEFYDMPPQLKAASDSEDRRNIFRLVLARIMRSHEFFEKVYSLQPRFMAVFGPDKGTVFKKLYDARTNVAIAAEMLSDAEKNPHPNEEEFWNGLKADVFPSFAKLVKKGDQVGQLVADFKSEIEKICRPLLDKQYRP